MPSFSIFDVAGAGMSAQSVRLNTTASNLANAESISGDPNTVYRAKHPVFSVAQAAPGASATESAPVRVTAIVESDAPPMKRYDPGHPLADGEGFVYAPNVNTVEEMVDMISASRSYQNDVEVMKTARDLMLATLRIGQQ
jgi:flagellar basal-body rod protein FlgC